MQISCPEPLHGCNISSRSLSLDPFALIAHVPPLPLRSPPLLSLVLSPHPPLSLYPLCLPARVSIPSWRSSEVASFSHDCNASAHLDKFINAKIRHRQTTGQVGRNSTALLQNGNASLGAAAAARHHGCSASRHVSASDRETCACAQSDVLCGRDAGRRKNPRRRMTRPPPLCPNETQKNTPHPPRRKGAKNSPRRGLLGKASIVDVFDDSTTLRNV